MGCQSERRANKSLDYTIPVPMSLDGRELQPTQNPRGAEA